MHHLSIMGRNYSSIVLAFVIFANVQGWEENRVYIDWPPNGSRVSAGSLSASGLRVEFSGGISDHLVAYWATLSVNVGNTTIIPNRPYSIRSIKRDKRTPIAPRDIQRYGKHEHDAGTSRRYGGDSHANPRSTARRVIPFNEVFVWDGLSYTLDEELEDAPLDMCPDADFEETLTVAVRLFRRRNGSLEAQPFASAESSSSPAHLFKQAAEASSTFQLIMRWGETGATGRAGKGGGGTDEEDTKTEVRGERILVDFLDSPGQMFTATFLADVGYTALIQRLNLFSNYTVDLKINGSSIMYEHLSAVGHGRQHRKEARLVRGYGWVVLGQGERCRLEPTLDPDLLLAVCRRDGSIDSPADLTTSREVKVHTRFPVLPLGSFSARLEVRVGEAQHLVAVSDAELVVVGEHVEGALGYVEPATAEWVHAPDWCNATESNGQTCTRGGHRPRGRGVPEQMRNSREVCEALFDAGVRRILVYGDSYARHLYIALSTVSSGDFSHGGLKFGPDPLENDRIARQCCGSAQYREKECRRDISINRTVCDGSVMLVRASGGIPKDYGRGDVILLSIGRHETLVSNTNGDPNPEAWTVPVWTLAKGPWEAEVACGLGNRFAMEVWARDFCRSANVRGSDSTTLQLFFVNWHVSAWNSSKHQSEICRKYVENSDGWVDHEDEPMLHAPISGADGECNVKARAWTPNCPVKREEGILTNLECFERHLNEGAIRRNSRRWEEALQDQCGEEVQIIDVIPITSTLVDQLPGEAIKMTEDGFHWGSRVNVLEIQMFLQRIWEVLSPKR